MTATKTATGTTMGTATTTAMGMATRTRTVTGTTTVTITATTTATITVMTTATRTRTAMRGMIMVTRMMTTMKTRMTTTATKMAESNLPFSNSELLVSSKIRANLRLLAIAAILFAAFCAGLAYVQYGASGLVGNDGYYHMKMGYLMRTQGLKPSFPYLPLTILNEASFYDHHMLYHAYLALFAGLDPALDGGASLTQGAKVASIVLPALAFLAAWWLLRRQNVPFAA